MPNFLSDEKFRELARTGKTDDSGLRKQFTAEVKVHNDETRELLFTISTDSVDRHGDKISVEGWQLDAYRKNPVVLWAHQYDTLPIARAKQVWTEGGKLKSIAEFVPKDNPATGRLSEGIYQLYKQGFMSATSVGFIPHKWAWTEDKDRKFGIDFEEQELLEYSCVPIPANPEALIEARKLGIDTEPVAEWALKTLFPNGINRRLFENFLSDSGGFSRKEALRLAALCPKGNPQSDSETDTSGCIEILQQFRKSLK